MGTPPPVPVPALDTYCVPALDRPPDRPWEDSSEPPAAVAPRFVPCPTDEGRALVLGLMGRAQGTSTHSLLGCVAVKQPVFGTGAVVIDLRHASRLLVTAGAAYETAGEVDSAARAANVNKPIE